MNWDDFVFPENFPSWLDVVQLCEVGAQIFLRQKKWQFFTKNGDFPGESPKMVTILVKEQVIFLVIAENREIPVTIIVTFFGDNIVTKYGDDFFTGNGGFPSESP